MYKRILLAYDGSQTGQKALLDCSDIAQWNQSELFLVAVMPSPATFIGAEGGVYDAGSEERDREQYQGILDEGCAGSPRPATTPTARSSSATRSTRSPSARRGSRRT